MKRREFLASSAGVAGSMIPLLGGAAGRPCPPPTVRVNGGPTTTTACSPASALADWVTRSSGPGVVWAHNFASANEVSFFRWTKGHGNNPDPPIAGTTLVWDPADGFGGGGSIAITIPTGGVAGGDWIRPFSALNGTSNGIGVPDPAASGTLPRRSWNHADGYDQPWNFRTGLYGCAFEQAANPTWNGDNAPWDGSDFWIQCRVKLSASRWQGGTWSGTQGSGNPPGKLIFIDVTPLTGYQEIVVRSPAKYAWNNNTGAFDMYTVHGSYYGGFLGNPQGAGGGSAPMQPGNAAATNCTEGHSGVQNCWEFPADEWVTLLFHITPGKQNDFVKLGIAQILDCPFPDTGIQVWIARAGDTQYTKIWEKLDYRWFYDSNGLVPNCFNALKFSGYMNNVSSVVGWTQKYTQVIFSKQFIPCPQA